MFDALAARKLIRLVLIHRVVLYVALVASEDDRRFFPNLMNQLLVPSRRPLKRVLVRHVVHQQSPCTSLSFNKLFSHLPDAPW